MIASKAPATAVDGPVIEAVNLKQHFVLRRGPFLPPQVVRAVDGVSFRLPRAQTLAVVGESGCGKSTLARMITMIDPPTSGDLLLQGRPVSEIAPRIRRQTVQMIFQNPFGSLNPRKRVGQILEEPLIVNGEGDREQRREKALLMMSKVGLRPDQYDRYPHMFSGGQRQRIAIARSLMLNPRVVIADEPVSALDVSIQAQVLNLLMDLQDEFGVAYLFISHDLSVVRHIARDVIVMYLGRAVEHGPRDLLFQEPRHPYTRALLAATPMVAPHLRRADRVPMGELPSPLNPPSGCPYHKRCPYTTTLCTTDLPVLRPVAGRLVACHHADELDPMAPVPVS
ncbi:MAG: dipeptide ABC transporter ATP-binding protein [Azospirillaceae bacterium]|nr:dipeptide ABC transporter ATP-binding protein [Azospirillaceae bacterium]